MQSTIVVALPIIIPPQFVPWGTYDSLGRTATGADPTSSGTNVYEDVHTLNVASPLLLRIVRPYLQAVPPAPARWRLLLNGVPRFPWDGIPIPFVAGVGIDHEINELIMPNTEIKIQINNGAAANPMNARIFAILLHEQVRPAIRRDHSL